LTKIEEIKNPKLWDKIVCKSNQYSLLCSSKFLSGLTCPHKFFLLKEKQNIKMAVLIFENKKKFKKYFLQDFNYNQGFYFFDNDLTERKRNKERIRLINIFLKEMTKNYSELRFSLNYNIKDIRAFQWFDHPKKTFQINTVYTSIIQLNEFKTFEEYIKSIRYERRREYRLFTETNYKIIQENDHEKFIKLYKFLKPNIGKLMFDTHLKVIRNANKMNFSRINFLLDKNKIIAGTLFYYHKNRAYYAFSVSNPNYKKKVSCTAPLILEQINYSFKNKIENVDFLGINSPNRGDFKESFGGKLDFFSELFYKKI
tara:strand:+ start:1780 stop:2718 length:939 start_codon:yes stop_codon:yes gene_type:complete